MITYYGTNVNYWKSVGDGINFAKITNMKPYYWREDKKNVESNDNPLQTLNLEQNYKTFFCEDGVLYIKYFERHFIEYIINILLFFGYELCILLSNIIINKDISQKYNWNVQQWLFLKKLTKNKCDGTRPVLQTSSLPLELFIANIYHYEPLKIFLFQNYPDIQKNMCFGEIVLGSGQYRCIYTDGKFHL